MSKEENFELKTHAAESELAFTDLQNAMAEEEKILGEMKQVLASTPDRVAAEKIILEQYASRMDVAMGNSRLALKKWLAGQEADIKE